MSENLTDRVAKLEARMESVTTDLSFIKNEVITFSTSAASKEDLDDLKELINKRDDMYVKNMWKVIYGLLAVVGAIALVAAGIETTAISSIIPSSWIQGIGGGLILISLMGLGIGSKPK